MEVMKKALCPYCYNGYIVKVQGVYMCRECFRPIEIKDYGGNLND